MSGTLVHAIFDVLAWATALGALLVLRRTRFRDWPVAEPLRLGYAAAVLFGAGAGAVLFGTLNLRASGLPGVARSVEGALAGAILAVELWKRSNGVTVRTGAVYALPLALGIAVGRIGCLMSGMDDFTYGTPTGANWGWDFGDGIPRHPVQLYESVAMAGFALLYTAMLARGPTGWKRDGFHIAVLFYGAQRFVWEFLKPYEPVLAGLTLFQLLSLALIAYAVVMLRNRPSP